MDLLNFVECMKHSPVKNYGIPGLTSWLIGAPSEAGCVRLFECSRDHQEPITPHSHRFDFFCMVLAGEVKNIIWEKRKYWDTVIGVDDLYQASELEYMGDIGQYEKRADGAAQFRRTPTTYKAGENYSMKRDQIHSIFFSAGTKVLFFEGPQRSTSSEILEPFVDGELVPTFKVEPWMFKKPSP